MHYKSQISKGSKLEVAVLNFAGQVRGILLVIGATRHLDGGTPPLYRLRRPTVDVIYLFFICHVYFLLKDKSLDFSPLCPQEHFHAREHIAYNNALARTFPGPALPIMETVQLPWLSEPAESTERLGLRCLERKPSCARFERCLVADPFPLSLARPHPSPYHARYPLPPRWCGHCLSSCQCSCRGPCRACASRPQSRSSTSRPSSATQRCATRPHWYCNGIATARAWSRTPPRATCGRPALLQLLPWLGSTSPQPELAARQRARWGIG